MNYKNELNNTAAPVAKEIQTEPINSVLVDAQTWSTSSLVLLNKLHNFLFAEDRTTP